MWLTLNMVGVKIGERIATVAMSSSAKSSHLLSGHVYKTFWENQSVQDAVFSCFKGKLSSELKFRGFVRPLGSLEENTVAEAV